MDRIFGRLGFGSQRQLRYGGLDAQDWRQGERKAEPGKNDEGWLIRERSHGSIKRALTLPEGVYPDKITADYNDGVLKVHIPKAAAALKHKTHRIALGAAPASHAVPACRVRSTRREQRPLTV
jgi:hypothetical protein